MYIDNGVNINASWTQAIAFSQDGVKWSTISKNNLSVKPTFINNPNNAKGFYQYSTLAKIRLEYDDGKVAAEFDIQNVANQASWVPVGSEVALQIAVSDINSWL